MPTAPDLHLDGFDGPLDLLLDLVERERIDLSRISVRAMAEQFVAAMAQFEKLVSLERRAGWVVLATRLVELRARLLFPATPEAAETALRDAERELARLRELRLIKAVTAWLEARPQWGQDVFTRSDAAGIRAWPPTCSSWKPASRCLRQRKKTVATPRSISRRPAGCSAFQTPWLGYAPHSRR
ncbi:MAG: segregation/condensation protein A [Rhodopila sp.]